MKVEPLFDRILVKKDGEKLSKGGIIIPDSAQEKMNMGTVIAVGPGRYELGNLIPMTLKAGDRVLFPQWSGSEVYVDHEKMLLIKEEDINGRMVGES